MITEEVTIPTLYCSFCGKSGHEVLALIAGPTVYCDDETCDNEYTVHICDECTALCQKIVDNKKEREKL